MDPSKLQYTTWIFNRIRKLDLNLTLIILQYLSASLPGAMSMAVGMSVSADQMWSSTGSQDSE